MHGYLDDAKATAETIDADGWLHTGDVGNLDARGYLRITDRPKDMYIAGGFNRYPAEIERAMAAHPAIAPVAVIGVPASRQGEARTAYCQGRPGQPSHWQTQVAAWLRLRARSTEPPTNNE